MMLLVPHPVSALPMMVSWPLPELAEAEAEVEGAAEAEAEAVAF